jgi:ABC-type bacteriocin/lantibiotic exporter with double-glycine peptidase domain
MLPRKLSRYIFELSALHQVALVVLTVVVFLMEVIPLELQRRIVNDAVKHRAFEKVVTLCLVYAGVVLSQGGIKMGLNIYRGWVGQRAVQDLRSRIRALEDDLAPSGKTDERGVEISMIVVEAEPVGLFVASALSEPLLQAGILTSVFAYMVHIDPVMASIAAVIFLLQFGFVPLMQRGINRRSKASISLLRVLSASLTNPLGAGGQRYVEDKDRIGRLFSLNMRITVLKFSMNFLMNFCTQLQIIAALLYGSWLVLNDQLVIGGVVAFISGVTRLTDPWGDLVNYFRELSLTTVKYRLLANTVREIAAGHGDGALASKFAG